MAKAIQIHFDTFTEMSCSTHNGIIFPLVRGSDKINECKKFINQNFDSSLNIKRNPGFSICCLPNNYWQILQLLNKPHDIIYQKEKPDVIMIIAQ